jgi:hypothetical protein
MVGDVRIGASSITTVEDMDSDESIFTLNPSGGGIDSVLEVDVIRTNSIDAHSIDAHAITITSLNLGDPHSLFINPLSCSLYDTTTNLELDPPYLENFIAPSTALVLSLNPCCILNQGFAMSASIIGPINASNSFIPMDGMVTKVVAHLKRNNNSYDETKGVRLTYICTDIRNTNTRAQTFAEASYSDLIDLTWGFDDSTNFELTVPPMNRILPHTQGYGPDACGLVVLTIQAGAGVDFFGFTVRFLT